MNIQSALQTFINLGYNKEKASAALKEGKEVITNALLILRNSTSDTYFPFFPYSPTNKQSNQESRSKCFRQEGIPVGLQKYEASNVGNNRSSSLFELFNSDLLYASWIC